MSFLRPPLFFVILLGGVSLGYGRDRCLMKEMNQYFCLSRHFADRDSNYHICHYWEEEQRFGVLYWSFLAASEDQALATDVEL